MATINPYLAFDGTCREGMEFYHNAFGGEIHIMGFDSMLCDQTPEAKDRVMHANTHSGGIVLMASDTPPGQPCPSGSSYSISINCSSEEEQDRLFGILSGGGNVTMTLEDQFWGARSECLRINSVRTGFLISIELKRSSIAEISS